ncbi:tubulin/FtsZ family protein [Chloroflexota bacterium]
MKLLVIGCGQCGGRVADEFARLNIRARSERGIEIITGVFAVNTDVADLSGLSNIRRDYQHRILIGNQKTGGHGVGKINELGAEIAMDDGDKVIDAIRDTPHFNETDAFLIVSSAAGGTGSGAIPTLTKKIKERYGSKPVYNLIVLPFMHEEATEERTTYNTATCIKSAYLAADAIFLVDNQRFVKKDFPIKDNLAKINNAVVSPFYNLLCAGEEKKAQYIGAKMIDAGDIIQTLVGWTVIGHGQTPTPGFRFSFGKKGDDFRDKGSETHRGTHALQGAINELSLKCDPVDARRCLYLVSGPPKQMSMDMLSNLASFTKGIAPESIIRSGDYPRGKDAMGVTVILSELINVSKVMDYFAKTIEYIHAAKRRWGTVDRRQESIQDIFKDIPSLLG